MNVFLVYSHPNLGDLDDITAMTPMWVVTSLEKAKSLIETDEEEVQTEAESLGEPRMRADGFRWTNMAALPDFWTYNHDDEPGYTYGMIVRYDNVE